MNLFRNGGAIALAVLVGLTAAFLAYGVTTEVPIGSVRGHVFLEESMKDFGGAAIIIRPKTNDDLKTARVRFFRADKHGRFNLTGIPTGLYEVEVSAMAHELKKGSRTLLVEEGKTLNLELPLAPQAEYLNLYASQHVFLPSEEAMVQLHGFIRGASVDVGLYQIPLEEVLDKRNLYDVLSPMAQATSDEQIKRASPSARLLKEDQWKVQPDDAEGTFQHNHVFGKLKPGLYFARFTAPPFAGAQKPTTRGTYLIVSDLALVAKRAKDKIHVFATDLATGVPVAGVPVRLASGDSVRSIGVTASDGTLQADLAPAESNQSNQAALVAQSGESAAIVTFNDYGSDPVGMRFFIQTDRPIYRPGDRVQFRAVARRPNGARYALPTSTVATYEIEDSEGKILKKAEAGVTRFGSISGDFMLPAGTTEAVTLNIRIDGKEDSRQIYVEAYRKPEFKITATPMKEFYLRGEKAQMKVKCEYYFGGPVVGADLSASVGRSPLWSWVDPETGDEESTGGGYSDYVAEAEAITDANGEAILSVDTSQISWGQWDTVDQELTFDISGSEGDDRWFDGQGKVKLLQGDISVQVDQDRWVSGPGEESEFTFKLSTPDAGSEATKNREITVETGFEVWDRNKSTFTPEAKTTIKTDENGIARLKVKPQNPGDFRVRASTRDRRGKVVQASAWLFVYRDGFGYDGPMPDLQVLLDKRSYEPGDTINALIRSSAKGGSVWVTLETDGVLAQRVVPIEKGVAKVSFPVTESLKPNAFVSASLVQKKAYASAQRRVSVKLTDEVLQVSVNANKKTYRPGEMASYKVTTRDHAGRPVQAEVALGVVDEAVYAIMADEDDPVDTFYPVRYSMISTYNSFPELYLDGGDKGDSQREIRTNFQDTAFWMPTVVTGADGSATVNVRLPDNLTSWRATATALTLDTQVGKSISNIVAKKDLMVRLATPLALTQLDEFALTATVNNSTSEPMDVQAQLKANGAKIAGEATKSVRVEAGQSSQVVWQVSVPDAGVAQFETTVASGSLRDGMRVRVPVGVHGKKLVDGAALEITSAVREFPVNVSAESGELRISAAPSLLAAIVPSIEALVDYPYGCAEQTMSRFVPAVVARQAMIRMGLSSPALNTKIDEVTSLSLQRIRAIQSSQGGWGWFEHDDPMPWTTATVLDGLWRVKQAGVSVDEGMVNRALAWGEKWLATDEARANVDDRSALSAGILRWKHSEIAQANIVATPEHGVFPIVAICHELIAGGSPNREQRLRDLWSQAIVRENAITWDDAWGARTTALALEALMISSPDDPRIPKVARGLVLQNKGNRWQSTMDTALAIQALIPYVEKSGGTGSSSVRVLVNGTPVASAERTGTQEAILTLPKGESKVRIMRQGEGAAFVTYTLTQTPMQPTMEAVPIKGLMIKRLFYTLAAGRMEDGTMSLLPSTSAVDSVTSGSAFRCIVTIEAKEPLEFAMIEIPLPSNARISFRDDEYDWDFWYAGRSVLDDKVVFFSPHIPKGKSVIDFNLRAEAVGTSAVLPAQVIEMYNPDRQASTSSMRLEVHR